MALATYSDLKAAIAAWPAEGTSLDSVIPDFIRLAEVNILNSFRARALVSTLSLTYAAAATSVQLPADLISIKAAYDYASGRSGRVEFVSAERYVDLQINAIQMDGTKTYLYADNRNLVFVSSPTVGGEIRGLYLAKEPALSDSNTTNYILTNYPDIYLFGSLIELAIYQKDGDAAAGYRERFNAAMLGANEQSPARNSGQVYRSPGMTVV